MDAHALRQWRSLPWRRVLLTLAALVAVAVIAAGLATFFWLRGYQSLGRGSTWGANPDDGVMVEPTAGSGGTDVFFPRYRQDGTFRVQAAVANHGRFAVTILGPPTLPADTESEPVLLVATETKTPTGPSYHGAPIDAHHPIRLRPGEEREINFVFKFNWRCIGGQPPRYWTSQAGTYESFNGVKLRTKHARWFERNQSFTFPFAVTIVCRDALMSREAIRAGLAPATG